MIYYVSIKETKGFVSCAVCTARPGTAGNGAERGCLTQPAVLADAGGVCANGAAEDFLFLRERLDMYIWYQFLGFIRWRSWVTPPEEDLQIFLKTTYKIFSAWLFLPRRFCSAFQSLYKNKVMLKLFQHFLH